ncbi:MAG: hypothetical protein ACTHU1_11700 [Arachnia sp.]
MTVLTDEDHEAWKTRLEELSQRLIEWYEGAESLLEEMPGSILYQDGDRWLARPLGLLARNLFLNALNTLRTCVDVFQVPSGPELTTTGVSPLTRTALMASTQAYWALAPDDGDTRVIRGLRLAIDEFHHESQWVNLLLDTMGPTTVSDGHRELAEAARPRLDRYLRETTDKLGDLGFYKATTKRKDRVRAAIPQVTETVTELASALREQHPELSLNFQLEWRAASGHSHAKSWQHKWSPHAEIMFVDADKKDIGATRSNPSIVTFAAPFELAVIATDIAMSRYYELAHAPAVTPTH